jgi:alkylated DNA repair dioxygenase AlkB
MQRNVLGIEGLSYGRGFLSPSEQKDAMRIVSDAKFEWNGALKGRRTAHYGVHYDYNNPHAKPYERAPPIPDGLRYIAKRLVDWGIMAREPDELLVNEYHPGQGIANHTDHVQAFGDDITTISLGSEYAMDFLSPGQSAEDTKHLLLQLGSVLSMRGFARYKARHGIAKRKSDARVLRAAPKTRGYRVSLTWRIVTPAYLPRDTARVSGAQ